MALTGNLTHLPFPTPMSGVGVTRNDGVSIIGNDTVGVTRTDPVPIVTTDSVTIGVGRMEKV